MIDRATLAGSKDPLFQVLASEVDLARGRFDSALNRLKALGEPPALKGRIMQDRGLALSMLGRSEEAFATLKQAVIENASAWRAWNALGGEYDRRRDWKNAEDAYEHALATSGRAAIVLNNRGFSRVLQNRLDDGIADLVSALEKKPDLTAARTNLRLAMALKGDYDRALAAGPQEDKAALLNNVGYAALLRGDQARAQELFGKAIAARGEFYGRASNNLEMATGLQSGAALDAKTANGQR
jgi:Flp pilus assembly protein TadD